MSMGAIVTVHYTIPDEVVAKVIGDKGKKHIDQINQFFKMSGVGEALQDIGKEQIVNDELDWSDNGSGEGYFDDPEAYDDGKEVVAAFEKLLKQKDEIKQKFKEKTGLDIYLVFNDPEDSYDTIDGFAWAIDFSSMFVRSEKYKQFIDKFKTIAEWSQVVKFG